MTDQERKDVEAVVLNVLTDNFIVAKTGDWHDYEAAKNRLRFHRDWTPEQWEIAMRTCAEYCDV